MSASPSRVGMEGSAWTVLMASFVTACQVIQVMLVEGGGWDRVLVVTAELLHCCRAGLQHRACHEVRGVQQWCSGMSAVQGSNAVRKLCDFGQVSW